MTLVDVFLGFVGVVVILITNIPIIIYQIIKAIYGYLKSKVGKLVASLKRI
jgi:hypothetical protein